MLILSLFFHVINLFLVPFPILSSFHRMPANIHHHLRNFLFPIVIWLSFHYLSASHKYFAMWTAPYSRERHGTCFYHMCLQILSYFFLASIHKFSKCQWKQFFIAFNHSREFVALLAYVSIKIPLIPSCALHYKSHDNRQPGENMGEQIFFMFDK